MPDDGVPEATVERTGGASASAEVVVRNPQGLHLRPATEFAHAMLGPYHADITARSANVMRTGHPDPDDDRRAVAAEMPAGSVLVMDSQLWHCGGPNTTDDHWRLGLNVQYVRGFFRTQQNHYLGVPHDLVARYPERLRQLLGFDLYRGIMGHVDGQSPAAVIGADTGASGAYAASTEANVFGATEA